jgi:hypothetical protein
LIVIADVLDLSLVCSTQKILHHARLAERGVIARDPMKEAIGLELDMLNILYILLHSSASDLAKCTTFFQRSYCPDSIYAKQPKEISQGLVWCPVK